MLADGGANTGSFTLCVSVTSHGGDSLYPCVRNMQIRNEMPFFKVIVTMLIYVNHISILYENLLKSVLMKMIGSVRSFKNIPF